MIPDRDRADEGQFTEEVSSDDILALFPDHELRSASEVADESGIVRRTAYIKLQALVDQGT